MKTFYLYPELHCFGSFSQILPTSKPIKQQTDKVIGSCLEQQCLPATRLLNKQSNTFHDHLLSYITVTGMRL